MICPISRCNPKQTSQLLLYFSISFRCIIHFIYFNFNDIQYRDLISENHRLRIERIRNRNKMRKNGAMKMRNWTTFNLPFAQNVFFIFCLFAESKTIFAAHSFYFISFYFFLYLHLRLTWRGRAHAEQFYSLICTHANIKHSKYVFFFSVRLIIRLYCLIMRLSLTDWLTMRTAKRRDRNRKKYNKSQR